MYTSSESNSTRAGRLRLARSATTICFLFTFVLYVPIGRKPFSEPTLRFGSYMISSLA